MDYQKIKKVHVVYKTHLDIGFTDMGRNVLDRYVKEYIPHSVRLAEEMNGGKEKRFIWTVGSYLIDYYLKHADAKALSELEAAIERGDICWHGIASTTHTELLDMDLFQYGAGQQAGFTLQKTHHCGENDRRAGSYDRSSGCAGR